jgi:hypothetical protein
VPRTRPQNRHTDARTIHVVAALELVARARHHRCEVVEAFLLIRSQIYTNHQILFEAVPGLFRRKRTGP